MAKSDRTSGKSELDEINSPFAIHMCDDQGQRFSNALANLSNCIDTFAVLAKGFRHHDVAVDEICEYVTANAFADFMQKQAGELYSILSETPAQKDKP